MDGTGLEPSKRQRLDFNNASHRPQQQQPPISQSHTLPPPNSYPPQPPPPSPYHQSASHEHRSLPEPPPYSYTQSHSGHNTPIRDPRSFPLDTSYSRRGSASGSTRSPDEYNHFPSTRALNTVAPNDGQPYPSQHPIEHPGQFAPYQNHEGPLNGTAHHGLPMSAYSEHSHTVHGHPSDYNHSPPNMVHTQYSLPHPAGSSSQQNMHRPKKGTRAQQACDVCRGRKAKCDEGRPSCGFCTENSMRCNYQTVAPAKADRANQAILDSLAAIYEKQELMQERMDRMENLILSKLGELVAPGIKSPEMESGVRRPQRSGSPPKRRPSEHGSIDFRLTSKLPMHEQKAIGECPGGSLGTVGTDPYDVEKGGMHGAPPVAGHDEPTAVEHVTAAHRLLRWPSVRAAFAKSSTRDLSDDYVMKLEEKKGLLRVYGRGDGSDSGDGSYPTPTESITSSWSDEGSEVRSPPPSDGLWGSGLADAPIFGEVGGFGRDGKLEIGCQTLDKLLNLYLENIHILHPFLDKNMLTKMVKRFAADYSPDFPRKRSKLDVSTMGAPIPLEGRREPTLHQHKSAKRKHSDTQYQSMGSELASPTAPFAVQPRFQRAISTAIVLLVMALGKICEWRDPLPGPVVDDGKENPAARLAPISPFPSTSESASPLSIRQSPTSSTQTMSTTSTPSGLPMRDPSFRPPAEDTSAGLRNLDVIPGLAYYAFATDIMGNCHGGNDLSHVQANLLAALYTGQLARAFESWTWIHSASRACRYIVRDPRDLKNVPEPRQDLIKFAFWTCLQLESDILAELDLPQSGIQKVHGIDYPKGFVQQADFVQSDTPATKMMMYYSGQIHIRGILNHIQSNLHRPGSSERPNLALRDQLDSMLNTWRDLLPPQLQWDEEDPPSRNINDARLRAKFYGAQYIVHRPFLRLALDNEVQDRDVKLPRNNTFTPLNERRIGPMAPPRSNIDKEVPADILHSARTCVGAAMRSTTAFHNIIDHRRLVVTNILGTAHAQFGNVLVLATTYKSRSLHKLVPRDKLERLFERTITFLHSLGPISATLEKDANILELLRDDVLGRDGGSAREGASFSSNDY